MCGSQGRKRVRASRKKNGPMSAVTGSTDGNDVWGKDRDEEAVKQTAAGPERVGILEKGFKGKKKGGKKAAGSLFFDPGECRRMAEIGGPSGRGRQKGGTARRCFDRGGSVQ